MKWKIGLMVVLLLCVLMLPLIATAEIVSSGKCGDNVSWTLDEQGVMVVSGTGVMRGIDRGGASPDNPWKTAKSVIIQDGVTSIGYQAFTDCNNLSSIVIPNSVTSIGSYALYGCRSLTIK